MKLADLHARHLAGEFTFVGRGLRMRNGKLMDQICTVIGVPTKLPIRAVMTDQLIPRSLDDAPDTDVQEMRPRAIRPAAIGPLSLTARVRPCPAGYSIGHRDITAGTAGLVVRAGGVLSILTNAHVGANVNAGQEGDPNLQPGPYDGGHASDQIAVLTDRVAVNFGNPGPPDGGKKKHGQAARALWWNPILGAANLGARAVGCSYRAALVDPKLVRGKLSMPLGGQASAVVEQGNPNDVDACLLTVLDEDDVMPSIYKLGPVTSGRDPELGDAWEKMGRTTEHTTGIVSAIGDSAVDYGGGRVAQYHEQLVLRNPDGQATSAGGDSGSCIKAKDQPVMLGLLFAGDDVQGITIANRYSQVQRYLPFEFVS